MLAMLFSTPIILLCCRPLLLKLLQLLPGNCVPLPHSSGHLFEIDKHKLFVLANADETVSLRPRGFRLCWWFKLLSLSTYSCCRWCLSSGISTLSSLETTGPTHSKCLALFAIHGSSSSYCWLSNLMFCLAHTWASSSFYIQFPYYATSWLPSRPSTRWWFGNSIYAKMLRLYLMS